MHGLAALTRSALDLNEPSDPTRSVSLHEREVG